MILRRDKMSLEITWLQAFFKIFSEDISIVVNSTNWNLLDQVKHNHFYQTKIYVKQGKPFENGQTSLPDIKPILNIQMTNIWLRNCHIDIYVY